MVSEALHTWVFHSIHQRSGLGERRREVGRFEWERVFKKDTIRTRLPRFNTAPYCLMYITNWNSLSESYTTLLPGRMRNTHTQKLCLSYVLCVFVNYWWFPGENEIKSLKCLITCSLKSPCTYMQLERDFINGSHFLVKKQQQNTYNSNSERPK